MVITIYLMQAFLREANQRKQADLVFYEEISALRQQIRTILYSMVRHCLKPLVTLSCTALPQGGKTPRIFQWHAGF